MKAAELPRAELLRDALDDLTGLAREARFNRPAQGFERRGLIVALAELGQGSETVSHVELDLETGRLLLPILAQLVRAELARLGVEP